MGIDIDDFADHIKSREDFILFLDLLLKDLTQSKEEWENNTLENYLEAMSAFTSSVDGFISNNNINETANNPTWRLFAYVLLAGRIYE